MKTAEKSEKIFDVKLANMPMKLKTSNNEETVQVLVDLVNEKMTKVMASSKKQSLQNAALIVALNLAEELLSLKKRAREELDRLGEHASQLVEDLESAQLAPVKLDH